MADEASKFILGNESHLLSMLLAEGSPEEVARLEKIGPYRLVERLGEGGFGIVWKAEQTEPVKREVALKILKAGMDSSRVLSRFHQEQQALASMDHPNIAALLDAGVTESGRPYFVMEWVKGIKITSYCQEKELTYQKRVDLFFKACLGVNHAHQKGLIHRDLKPSNLLVAEVDGEPMPKIIDFGIAKAVAGNSGALFDGLNTLEGQVLGTPLYMSPEQLQGSVDVDTRSDVYSLGVLFYEVLTDSLPYAGLAKPTTNHAGMLKVMEGRQPMRPSMRVTHTQQVSTQSGPSAQPQRVLLPANAKDLDWIILKALEQDRERRYDSVASFMADIQRYQRQEPILARPPSMSYLVGRWVSRHRVMFAAVSLSLAALVSGAVLALWQAVKAREAQMAAEAEAKRANQAVSFLTGMLDRVAEQVAQGRNPEALKLALQNSEQLIRQLDEDPTLQQDLFIRVGKLYEAIGERRLALPLLKANVEWLAKQKGPESLTTLRAELNYLYLMVDHGTRFAAPPLLEDYIKRLEAYGRKGGTYWLEAKRHHLRCWIKLDHYERAKRVAEQLLKEVEELKITKNRRVKVFYDCAEAFLKINDLEKAQQLTDEAFAILREKPALAATYSKMIEARQVTLWKAKKETDQIIRLFDERLKKLSASDEKTHERRIKALIDYARVLNDLQQHPKAVEVARAALSEVTSSLKSEEEKTAARHAVVLAKLCLGECLVYGGELNEALRQAREALLVAEDLGNSELIAMSLRSLAQANRVLGDFESSFEYYRERQDRFATLSGNYKSWHDDLEEMCNLRRRQQRHAEAALLAISYWRLISMGAEAKEDPEYLGDAATLVLECLQALPEDQKKELTFDESDSKAWQIAKSAGDEARARRLSGQ